MVLLPVKQYYPQTDSATGHGDRMCFSSTCAMAIKYLLPGALRGSNADDDYLRTVSEVRRHNLFHESSQSLPAVRSVCFLLYQGNTTEH
jgi:hypothetical protein